MTENLSEARWVLPDPAILHPSDAESMWPTRTTEAKVARQEGVIVQTLVEFGVPAEVVVRRIGPLVTQFALEPGRDSAGNRVRASRITGLADDLALALGVSGVRVEVPIPGFENG